MSSSNDFYISVLSVFIIQFSSHCFGDYVVTTNLNTFIQIPLARPPLIQKESLFDPVTVVNDGKGIDLYVNTTSRRNFIFGGPTAPGSIYFKYYVRLNYNARIYGTSGVRINNVGTPITVDSFYYNGKYGFAALASFFPDGILVFREPVRIGPANEFFPTFLGLLEQIPKAGSRTATINGFAVSWLDFPQFVANYFSYTGLYASTINNIPVRYNTATIIVVPFEYSVTISSTQFYSLRQFFTRQSPIQSSTELFAPTAAPLYRIYGQIFYETGF